jgi:hypothetical protein
MSRNEHDDDGVLTVRRVLRVFRRSGLRWDLKLPGGIIIGTTAEHPFFAKGKGWTAAHELKPGDQIRLMEPGWVTVEEVEDTGRIETVYNLEVEDDHTYFVGQGWGWSVWAHNADYSPDQKAIDKSIQRHNKRMQSVALRAKALDDDGGHSYGDHGAHVTPAQHLHRLRTGETPTRPANPNADLPETSSGFATNKKHVEAHTQALTELAASPQLFTPTGNIQAVVRVRFRLEGAGYSYEIGHQGQLVRYEANNVRAVFRYNAATDTHRLITMFPEV